MSQGISAWVLEAPMGFGDAGLHAHHAIQITICLSGALALTCSGATIRAPAIAVAADAGHRLEAHGLLAFIFVEPESRFGRALARALFADAPLAALDAAALAPAIARLHATFDAPLGPADILAAARAVVDMLAAVGEPPMPDPRIQRIIAYAAAHLDAPLSLDKASAGIHLSPSRLRHLFVEQTGLAFRTYVLWLRLFRAVQAYSEGLSLTEAAHAAGFADSAHFSRAFKRTFGLPAKTLTRF